MAYGMQINALLKQVYRRVVLANNEADHKLNEELNQLLYKDPIHVGDKLLLHRPQSTTAHSSHLNWIGLFEVVKTISAYPNYPIMNPQTKALRHMACKSTLWFLRLNCVLHRPRSTIAHSSHLDWIGPFEVVKTNDMVIQVGNEKGETDWIHRAHICRFAPLPKHLSHNCLTTPFTTSRSPTRSWITTPKSIHLTKTGTTFCTNQPNKPTPKPKINPSLANTWPNASTLQGLYYAIVAHRTNTTYTHTHKSERDQRGLCYMTERDLFLIYRTHKIMICIGRNKSFLWTIVLIA